MEAEDRRDADAAAEDAAAAGEVVELDPDSADRMGAFEEDAMSEEDALEARFDNEEGANDGGG